LKSVDNPFKRFRNLFLASIAIDRRLRAVYPRRFTRNLENKPFETLQACNTVYYVDRSVLLKIKTLVESMSKYIWDPSGVFSVFHYCE